MPAERGKDAAERFAAAVDRGRSPRIAGGDADLARELGIVARLRSQEGTYGSHAEAVAMLRSPQRADELSPTAQEKARARQRLMALLGEPDAQAEVVEFPVGTPAEQTAPIPLVPVEGDLAQVRAATDATDLDATDLDATDPRTADAVPDTTAGTRTTAGPVGPEELLAPVTSLGSRRVRRSRPAAPAPARRRSAGLARRAGLVSSAALLVMVAFTGLGVFVSRDALPGQTLYPLKRATEAAALAMTFDDSARAQRNLELAAVRISEIEQLIALRGSDSVDPQLVRDAMSEFDVATSEGSRALLAGPDGTGALHAWAAKQSARLEALRSALPVPAVPAADTSIALLDRLLDPQQPLDTTAPTSTPADRVEAPAAPKAPRTPDAEAGSAAGGETDPSQDNGGLSSLRPQDGPLAEDPATGESVPSDAPSTDVRQGENAPLPLPLPGAPIRVPSVLPGMPGLDLG